MTTEAICERARFLMGRGEDGLLEAFSLTGKVAVVTGGPGPRPGHGLQPGWCGAKIVIADINEEKARATAEELRQAGFAAEAYQVDVAQRSGVDSLVSHVVERYGRLDVVVNSAGSTAAIPWRRSLKRITTPSWM